MTKAGDLKWDELFKGKQPQQELKKAVNKEHVPAAQHKTVQDQPISKRPVSQINKPGEVPRKPPNVEIAEAILANMPKQMRQPTHAEMVAVAKQMGLQKSPQDLQKAQKEWENKFNDFYAEAKKPVDPEGYADESGWGSGKSFNDGISAEELEKRNKFVSGNENE